MLSHEQIKNYIKQRGAVIIVINDSSAKSSTNWFSQNILTCNDNFNCLCFSFTIQRDHTNISPSIGKLCAVKYEMLCTIKCIAYTVFNNRKVHVFWSFWWTVQNFKTSLGESNCSVCWVGKMKRRTTCKENLSIE